MKTKLRGFNKSFSKPPFNKEDIPEGTVTELVVAGSLPAVVLLEDSMDENLNDLHVDPFAIQVNGIAAEIRLKKVINPTKRSGGISVATEDVSGELTYSKFKMSIHSSNDLKDPLNDHIANEDNEIDTNRVLGLACKLLRKFVEIYKIASFGEKDWFPDLSIHNIKPCEFLAAYNKNGDELWGSPQLYSLGTGVGLGADLKPDRLAYMQLLGMNNVKFDEAGLNFRIANRFFRNDDYGSGFIYSALAMEFWIFREVRRALEKRGLSEEEIEERLFYETKGGIRKSISREDAVKEVLHSRDFVNSPEYKEFMNKVIFPRDSLVHMKGFSCATSEAESCIKAVTEFQDYLDQEFRKAEEVLNAKGKELAEENGVFSREN